MTDISLTLQYNTLNTRLATLEKANQYQRCDCMWTSRVGACRESFDELVKSVQKVADPILTNELKQMETRLRQLERTLKCERWIGAVGPSFALAIAVLAMSWFLAARGGN